MKWHGEYPARCARCLRGKLPTGADCSRCGGRGYVWRATRPALGTSADGGLLADRDATRGES